MGTQTNGFSQASPVFIELNEGFRRQGGGRKALLPSADMTGGLEIWAEAPTVLLAPARVTACGGRKGERLSLQSKLPCVDMIHRLPHNCFLSFISTPALAHLQVSYLFLLKKEKKSL